MSELPSASSIIKEVLRDVAPERAALLGQILALEETHLSDTGTSTQNLVSALIERAAKLAAQTEDVS